MSVSQAKSLTAASSQGYASYNKVERVDRGRFHGGLQIQLMIAPWRNSSVCSTAYRVNHKLQQPHLQQRWNQQLIVAFCNYHAPSKTNITTDDSLLLFRMCYVGKNCSSVTVCRLRKSHYLRANIVPLEMTIVKRVLGKINRGSGFLYQTVKTCHTRPSAYSWNSLHTFSSGEKNTSIYYGKSDISTWNNVFIKWYHTAYCHSASLLNARMESNTLFLRLCYLLKYKKYERKVCERFFVPLCPPLICTPCLLNFSCPLPLPPSVFCMWSTGVRDHDGLVRHIAAARTPSLRANALTMAGWRVQGKKKLMTVFRIQRSNLTCTISLQLTYLLNQCDGVGTEKTSGIPHVLE